MMEITYFMHEILFILCLNSKEITSGDEGAYIYFSVHEGHQIGPMHW